jgi:hypothetical protein
VCCPIGLVRRAAKWKCYGAKTLILRKIFTWKLTLPAMIMDYSQIEHGICCIGIGEPKIKLYIAPLRKRKAFLEEHAGRIVTLQSSEIGSELLTCPGFLYQS